MRTQSISIHYLLGEKSHVFHGHVFTNVHSNDCTLNQFFNKIERSKPKEIREEKKSFTEH